MREDVEILRLAHAGDGVTADGLFVPYTVPGDVVRIERANMRARVTDILSSGPWRTDAVCRHFGTCGGCTLQHVAEAPYRAWKREQVRATLAQRGFADVSVDEVRAVPPGTRRRVGLKVRKNGAVTTLGFFEAESRNLVDVVACPVLSPGLAKLLAPLRTRFHAMLKSGETVELHATLSDTGVDLAVNWKRPRGPDMLMDLAQLAAELKLARLSWNGEALAVATTPSLRIGKFTVALPVAPFLQPTREGERILQDLVREGVGDASRVADVFSGCGTFALSLADGRTVHAFDSDGSMIAALADAAAHGKAGGSVSAERRDLFRRPLMASELAAFDAVVLDPPRAGARAQVEEIARGRVPRIVYVSCNPASFSRDARILCDGGYRLARVTPVDQFLWTAHVELVGVFERDAD